MVKDKQKNLRWSDVAGKLAATAHDATGNCTLLADASLSTKLIQAYKESFKNKSMT